MGLMTVSLMGRIWFLMLAVLAIGLIDRESGPAGRGAHRGRFQAWFTGFMVSRSMEEGTS